MHQLQRLDPARDHTVDRQVDRGATLDGAVEHGAVDQLALVVHGDHVGGLGLRAIALLDHFVLQAGGGGDHTRLLAVFFEEFLAGLGVVLADLGHLLFGTLLQGGEGLGELLIGQLLILLAYRVFDTQSNGLGIQVIDTFLSQALAHVQTDAVGRLLSRAFQLDLGLGVAAAQNQTHQGHCCCQPILFHVDSLSVRIVRVSKT